MSIPAIRLRWTLTIRSLMVVVALVAFGIAGWKAKQHWSECRSGAVRMRRLGSILRGYAVDQRKNLDSQDALLQSVEHPTEESPLSERDSRQMPEVAVSTTTLSPEEVDFFDTGHMKATNAVNRRDVDAKEAIGKRCIQLEAKYVRLAWRPWTGLRQVRAEEDELKRDLDLSYKRYTDGLEQIYPFLRVLRDDHPIKKSVTSTTGAASP